MDHSSSVSYGRHNLHLDHPPLPEEEDHIHHHRKSKKKSNNSSSSKRSSTNSNNTQNKGILKTFNSTTEDFLRKNEELLLKHKRQLLQSRSADNTLERRRSDEEFESHELHRENESSSSPHHHRKSRSSKEVISNSSIYATDPGSRRHHRHHRSSGGGGEKKKKKSSSSKNGGEPLDSHVIYDRPKVPALKISKKSSRKYSSPDEGVDEDHDQSNDIGFYENLKYPGVEDNGIVDHIYSNDNCLYDVPRPGNKRIMDDHLPSPPPSNEDVPESGEPEEAIYINSEYENNQDLYDVPKFRMEEPLTTIQEGEEIIPAPSTEELYENYPPVTPSDDICSNNNNANGNHSNHMNNSGTVRTRPIIMNRIENIYMNESYSDRGSSGYRSSPSIQSSEELYINETAIPSEDDEDEPEDRSGHQIEPVLASVIPSSHSDIPDSRDIAIETHTQDKNRGSGKAPLNSEEQRFRELKREKERHKALLIEAEILKKREENNNNNQNSNYRDFSSSLKKSVSPTKVPNTPETLVSPSPPPPLLFLEQSDLDDNKDTLGRGEEDKPVSVDFEEFDIEKPTQSKRIYHVPEPKNFTPKVEKNRSIEVYNETVRQRAQRKKIELLVNNNSLSEPEEDEDIDEKKEEGTKKKKEVVDKSKNIKDDSSKIKIQSKSSEFPVEEEDKDMPSVQKLRSRFEISSKTGNKKMGSSQSYDLGDVRREEGTSKPVNSAAKVFNVSAFQNNVKKKGGFRVMASLTRRSAVSISRALQDGEEVTAEGKRGSSAILPPVSLRTTQKGSRQDDNMSQHNLEQQHVFSSTRESRRNSNRQVSLLSSSKMFTRPPVSNLWDPTSLISSIYDVNLSSSSFKGGEETNGRHNYFEGYMDRLPSGKRKATIWNSWKTQYFVLTRGSLTAYFDESKKEAQEIFELFSGKIERMDSNIIGVTDRRGHFILLRIISKSNNEKEDEELTNKWINLLDIHTKKDYSSTFITPGTYDLSLLTKIIIVDFGGASVRAGIASRIPTLPKIFFPSVMAVAKDNEREKYFGLDAFAPEVRARCDLFHPMSFDRRTIDLIAFQGMFEKIFKDLGIDDPAEYELQLSVPRSLDDKTKIAVSSVLFEEFAIRSLNMAHQAVFSMYAYQSKTGIVVDIGERMDIIPIVDGYKVGSGMSRSPVGGRELRNRTAQYLQVKNHNLSTSSPVDDYVLRAALEKSAYVARNFDRELEIYEDNYDEHSQAIPYGGGGKELILGSERFEAIEGLFKPELWGLDQAGVHVLVHKAVRECPVDVRKEVTKSIYCSGGLSSVPGFAERLELEMERLTPNVKPKVHASLYSYHAAYLGAESHALSEGFDDMKMSREVWYSSEGNHTARMWTL
ncbi:unnamed protein product [Lepeophtheirus salmonis]|uniref:(salmon louse) hypothetical protein n=1 Tax=Lepeophtheirus salmonis TaxID=72036 RepID=A0A7R8GYT6_LEPSM|nr:unnamed protein product [Lepeophtheirus salmonis]CAF2752637.1 unnamed protein product [Lepeophtheirus salmonis]